MTAAGAVPSGYLSNETTRVNLADLDRGSLLGDQIDELRGCTVVLAARDQLTSALALIDLDGVAGRVVLCPPDLAARHFRGVIIDAGADVLIRDAATPDIDNVDIGRIIEAKPVLRARISPRRCFQQTEWVLLTSGTTGVPKLVLHTLRSLTSAFSASQTASPNRVIWSTFYDIRRYGGLQIFLRALHTGSMVLSSPDESTIQFLKRADANGITRISGTPSHWRVALMSGAARSITPQSVRLSGEIADQAILDGLRAVYPAARIVHAFASTEAGVAFEVTDGLAGFPPDQVSDAGGGVELKVINGALQIRSPGTALRYLGEDAPILKDDSGFVDTGDRLELRDGRYHFIGRKGGVINVGGLKVHPEEVEAVINSHPWVQMSLVRARRNPVTGAVVTAEIVVADQANRAAQRPDSSVITREIIEMCQRELARHKVPAVIRIVPMLDVSTAGKLIRPNA
jgi:acyl-coenzyme A synthetase/AMP-(fatty) acid ligase